MQDKDTTKSTFIQLFEPIHNKYFQKLLKDQEADKYVKKLTTAQLIQLVALAQIEQQKSLRDISNSLKEDELSQVLNLDSISASQISRRLRDLSPAVIQTLLRTAKLEFGKKAGFDALRRELGRISIIDSSTISLCFSQYRWAEFRKTKGAVKLHLRLKFFEGGVLPDKAVITPAKPADKTQMDALVLEEEDALNVFDRAYVDYKKFDHYCENGILFVTRLKSNAVTDVIQEFPVETGSLIKSDHKVYLGTAGINKMKNPLRRLETEDIHGQPLIILTNDFKLSSEQISNTYRYRWQIELFFKWIKQHFQVKHLYGLSQQAVENQLLITLTTYCLLMMVKLESNYSGPLLAIKRLLKTCLYEPFTSFLRKLHHDPQRTSRGRGAMDSESIYRETLRQVLAGEAEHLDDLTYDPVII